MKKIRRVFLLLFLYEKRLAQKVCFWLLLCAVPLLALGLRALSAGESGILHILLCQENPSDALSGDVVGRLLAGKSVIQYTLVGEPQEAYDLVESGKADAAWVFPDGMEEKLDLFTGMELREGGLVRVIEREENVALRLAREKLFGALYSNASYSLYRNFIHKDLGIGADEEELRQSYEDTAVEGSLFRLVSVNGDGWGDETVRKDFLVTPARGMLALLVLLCGLTATMYFLQDMQEGVLDAVPYGKRRKYLYLCQITVMGPVAAAVLAALGCLGVSVKWSGEIIWMAVYVAMCMGFCSLLQRICGNLRRLAAVVPALMLVSFVLCPVFFSLGLLEPVQYMLPPFYYLNAVHNGRFLFRMFLYCVIVFGVDLTWGTISFFFHSIS